MKTSKIMIAAALSLLAAAGAQAETYDGVHSISSATPRADVKTQAVAAARSENPYAEAASSRVTAPSFSGVARAAIRSEAVAAAHSPNPYAEGYGQGVSRVQGSVDRTAVRAAARATARGDQLPL
jgi:hypothetical protein